MYYIGIDIGGMSIKGGLVDENGTVYVKKTVVTQADAHYSVIVKDIADLCYSIIAEKGLTINDVQAVGMGIPGTINSQKGVITYSNNINFEKVPIVKEFRKHFDVPTFIGNDANVAALGEARFGAGKNCNDVIVITLGTGIGTGIIVDGKLLEGKVGAGAEGGHIGIRIGGEPCSCGKRGCWEAYASATALIRQTRRAIEKHPDSLLVKFAEEEGKVSGRTAFLAAHADDATGKAVVNTYIRYVAEGIISLVNLFRPDCVLIGGGISNEGDYLMERIQRRVNRYSYGGHRNPKVAVRKAELKNDAGMLGAVALCL
ncbi:MAG: ROK family protein [Clostridia bacterium]|nr:ROK family protein [Clostridia bacterium]